MDNLITSEEVKKIVLIKLGMSDIKEETFTLSLQEARLEINNYCNIEDVPRELIGTLTDMTRDLYLFYNSFSQSETGPTESENLSAKDIESIKMGDTTISLKSTVSGGIDYKLQHNYGVDNLAEKYASKLNDFRRLVW